MACPARVASSPSSRLNFSYLPLSTPSRMWLRVVALHGPAMWATSPLSNQAGMLSSVELRSTSFQLPPYIIWSSITWARPARTCRSSRV